jgi:hypothetical protein
MKKLLLTAATLLAFLSAAHARVAMTFVPAKALPPAMEGTWCFNHEDHEDQYFDKCTRATDNNDVTVTGTIIGSAIGEPWTCKLSNIASDEERFGYFADAVCHGEGQTWRQKLHFYVDKDYRLVQSIYWTGKRQ